MFRVVNSGLARRGQCLSMRWNRQTPMDVPFEGRLLLIWVLEDETEACFYIPLFEDQIWLFVVRKQTMMKHMLFKKILKLDVCT